MSSPNGSSVPFKGRAAAIDLAAARQARTVSSRLAGLPATMRKIDLAAALEGALVALPTRHGKEQAIAPAFRTHLDAIVRVADVDTDALGTFTGDVARPLGQAETAIEKARRGMTASGLSFAIASEGSYRPEGAMFTGCRNIEMLTLVGRHLAMPVTEISVDVESNFSHINIGAAGYRSAAFWDFLAGAGFPEHALVVVPHGPIGRPPVTRGIRSLDDLGVAVEAAMSASGVGLAHVETDMRAHMNPTRMRAITLLAERLALILASGGCTSFYGDDD
jgi:hypothetical protein